MSDLGFPLPVTTENVAQAYERMFAPWVKALGLRDIEAGEGWATALLPQQGELQLEEFFSGAICGQAVMAAVDTVASIAVLTTPRAGKGTASQNTQFLRPAVGEDLHVKSQVLQFGSTIVYVETKVSKADSDELVAHSTSEYVF